MSGIVRGRRRVAGLALFAPLLLVPGTALAQARNATVLAPATVIATTPLPGTVIDADKVPFAVETLSGVDLDWTGSPDVAGGLARRWADVSVSDDLDDPLQPDILYRGFAASPVLGAAQGLAVYQGGARINEAFGDAVNWDLVPADAVARIDVVGSNPLYGLNALGGAVVMTMKTGFDDAGGAATVSSGSFGERALHLTYGAHGEHAAVFLALRGDDDDGWRLFSSDSVRQVYADLAWRNQKLRADLSYSWDDNYLHGEGATPVQELAIDRRLVFTSPQLNANRLNFAVLNATLSATPTLSLQVGLHLRDFAQDVENGDTTSDTACSPPSLAGLLCQPDGTTPLFGADGTRIPDLSDGGRRPIGENDRERLRSLSFGGALQASSSAPLLGHSNALSVGVDAEIARTEFATSAEPGVVGSDLAVEPSGFVVATPEGTAFTATPVSLKAGGDVAGLFATDTVDLAGRLSATVSARFNWTRVALADRKGTRLDGVSTYARFDPVAGMAYRMGDSLTGFVGYAEGSRAPTPSEIECSAPQSPCLLPSSLSADPPGLKQVVSRTWEAGLRGSRSLGGGRLDYHAGVFRTDVSDDIYAVANSLSAGFFRNIAGTRRQGADLSLTYRDARRTAYLSYAYVDATFRTSLTLPSPSNPLGDANGDIQVRPGDHLPGIPRQRFKLGADTALAGGVRVGGDLQLISSQSYRGDESNRLAPLPGYAVVSLHATYAATRRLTLFVRVANALNAHYATFGVLGDPTGVGAPGVPNGAAADPRFLSPAPPVSAYAGVRVAF